MVICVVIGCSNRSDRFPDCELVSFHRIPAVSDHQGEKDYELRKERRDGYLRAISREDLDIRSLDKYRICSAHFVTGKPASLYEKTRPNWLPTLNLGHNKVMPTDSNTINRWERLQRRNLLQEIEGYIPAIVDLDIESFIREEIKSIAEEQLDIARQYYNCNTVSEKSCHCSSEVESLRKELADAKHRIQLLQCELEKHVPPFCEEYFINDEFTQFYTGLPNIKIVKAVFEHVYKTLPGERATKLSAFQEFICTLLKLRLNSPLEDLSYRFGVSTSTVSRILVKWLRQMDIRMEELIYWPDREALHKTMPACFQASFGKKVAIIIDCFEIFIERPSNLQARASTWSNYKHKNTVKVLMGITPQGVVSFVSETWGGRVSDKHLTDNCGILKKLLPGDVVLADRGFDIAESVGMMQARLHIPAFTKGKAQLSALEVENTRTIANVRIHVEHVIGSVWQKYPILQGTLPIDFVSKRKQDDIPLIDRIVRICCALNNLCNSVVPFE